MMIEMVYDRLTLELLSNSQLSTQTHFIGLKLAPVKIAVMKPPLKLKIKRKERKKTNKNGKRAAMTSWQLMVEIAVLTPLSFTRDPVTMGFDGTALVDRPCPKGLWYVAPIISGPGLVPCLLYARLASSPPTRPRQLPPSYAVAKGVIVIVIFHAPTDDKTHRRIILMKTGSKIIDREHEAVLFSLQRKLPAKLSSPPLSGVRGKTKCVTQRKVANSRDITDDVKK
ncbi:hypothetical protein OUZ56_005079 [Daphnia magna]|uniref:Uncharacterized protein n=1 Tax=Daphnia magna TaxID=35525 RepID=A0ABQ9YRQ9_9CRUS|nr:hypothetical protein OUZ56_005079 [Daphnia magna]